MANDISEFVKTEGARYLRKDGTLNPQFIVRGDTDKWGNFDKRTVGMTHQLIGVVGSVIETSGWFQSFSEFGRTAMTHYANAVNLELLKTNRQNIPMLEDYILSIQFKENEALRKQQKLFIFEYEKSMEDAAQDKDWDYVVEQTKIAERKLELYTGGLKKQLETVIRVAKSRLPGGRGV